MRLRNITGSRDVIAASPYVVQEAVQKECPGTWRRIFGNDNPVYIEIGMGKGKFIHANAKANPNINYVGIEKYSSVLLRAIQKMEEEELPNLKFLRMDAEEEKTSLQRVPGKIQYYPQGRRQTGVQDRQPRTVRFRSGGVGARRLEGRLYHL